jgi:acyl-CoA synthetase (AMP-forming)/AMP-acid ligase II
MNDYSQIFTRHTLHPDIVYHQPNDHGGWDQFSKHDIVEAIRQWKNLLAEKAGIGPGSRVMTGGNVCDLRYISAVIAVFELGATIAVLDKVPVITEPFLPRGRILAPFDLMIAPDDYLESDDAHVRTWAKNFCRQVMKWGEWFDYTSTTNSSWSDVILAEPKTVMIATTTSGSTGDPKPIFYPHDFMMSISDRTAKLYDHKESDRVLHLTNLHHGGSSSTFFIPTLSRCKTHFFKHGHTDDPAMLKEVADTIVKERINKIMFPDVLNFERITQYLPRLEHELICYNSQSVPKTTIDTVKRANISAVFSWFGSSETLGPLFESKITPDTDPATHDTLNYSKPLDDYYKIEVEGDRLHIISEFQDHYINDAFVVDSDGNFHYSHRTDLLRVNHVTLSWKDLTDLLEGRFGEHRAHIVPDSTMNKIYLLVDQSYKNDADVQDKINAIAADLRRLSVDLDLNAYDFCNMSDFYSGIKFNRQGAQNYFRQKLNLL